MLLFQSCSRLELDSEHWTDTHILQMPLKVAFVDQKTCVYVIGAVILVEKQGYS